MEKLIQRGARFIVASGWESFHLVDQNAQKYPDIRFLLNDVPLPGRPNVVSTVFAQNEGAFLAGALAGWVTKTGIVGFIGGEDIPVIRSFLTGFDAALAHVNVDVTLLKKFIALPGATPSGFSNPGIAYKLAETFYTQGADIIFGVAGLSGNGVIRAARKHRRFAIGVDANQDHMAKGLVLTSVMKRLDKATFDEVKQALTGKFTSGIHYYGLKEGGISLSPMTHTRHLVPEKIMAKLSMLEKQIKDGTITVPGKLIFEDSESRP